MNSLHWIAYVLFASVLVTTYFLFIEATFLLFTAGVLVLSIAVYVKDLKDNEQQRKDNRL